MSQYSQPPRPGMKLIFRPWVINKKTGQRIYPKKGKFFAFWVDA